MPYPIENKLVIAVASSALFNLIESDSVSSSFCGKNGLPLFHVRKAEWEQFPVYKKLRVCRQTLNFL